jgi:hypothetical protein
LFLAHFACGYPGHGKVLGGLALRIQLYLFRLGEAALGLDEGLLGGLFFLGRAPGGEDGYGQDSRDLASSQSRSAVRKRNVHEDTLESELKCLCRAFGVTWDRIGN